MALRFSAVTFLASGLWLACVGGSSAEETQPDEKVKIIYRGTETRLLQDDLVEMRVALAGAKNSLSVEDYAACAVAQYTQIRGYGYARHIRTSLNQSGGSWEARSVYLISSSRPNGFAIIDAAQAVRTCKDQGIPTV